MLSVLLKNPFLLLLIPFVVGIHFYTLVDYSLSNVGLLVMLLFSVALFILLHFLKRTSSFLQLGRMALLAVSFFVLGNISMSLNDIKNTKQWYGHSINNTQAYKVTLTDLPVKKEKSWVLQVDIIAAIQDNNVVPTKGKCYLYIFSKDTALALHKNDEIIIPNDLVSISNSGNPYGFDYAAYCSAKGIFHQIFVQPDDIIIWKQNAAKQDVFSLIKATVNTSIAKNVKDPTTSGLMRAIMLNERALLHDDIWKTYSQTGIVHIIAISGMHVTILFGLLLYALFWIKSKKWQWIKYAIGLPIVWIYVILTDNPASAVRAAVMFSIVALSIFLNKDQKPINSWSAAAFFMLFLQPMWLYDVGMQLSFLCILSIVLFYNPIYRLFYCKNKIIDNLWKGIAVSIAVQILVVPIVIYYFHQFPIWSIVANIPAGVYSIILMYGTIAIAILSPIGVDCVWIGDILAWCTHWFNHFIAFLALLSPQRLTHLFIDSFDFILMMLAISMLSISVFTPKANYVKAGLVSLIILFITLTVKDYKAVKREMLIVYNSNGTSSADFIIGKKHYPIQYTNDSISDKVQLGIINPARIGFRVMKKGNTSLLKNGIQWKGKTILFLQNEGDNVNINADIIVLSKSVNNVEKAIDNTKAKKVILDGTINRSLAQRISHKMKEHGVEVHSVINDGAWVEY